MTAPVASVCRAVHYVSRGSADGRFPATCRAATVTEVGEDPAVIGVMVANPSGLFFHPLADGGVTQDEDGKAGGTWHWPERT